MSIRPFKPLKLAIGSRTGHKYNAADLRRQLDNLSRNIKAFTVHVGEEAVDVVYDALKPTFEKAQHYVPKDTMALHDSGYLMVEKTSKGIEASMGYAYKGNPYYALYVHEIPRKHAAPTRHKFLQIALQEDLADIEGRLVKGLAKAGGTNG